MKQQISHKIILFNVILLCIVFNITTLAQSGRPIETPTLGNEVSTSTEMKKEYPPCEKRLDEVIYIRRSKINLFIEELNRLGNCGYRIEKVAKLPLLSEETVFDLYMFGVVKLDDGNRYEYNWFAGRSPGEVQTIANKQAEQGFYFRQKMLFISGRCSQAAEKRKTENETLGGLGDILNLRLGASGSVFIFERKNGIIKKNEYRVIDGRVTGKKGELETNQKIMDDYIARGFRPVDYFYLGMFNTYTIIMEKAEDLKTQGEYRLLNEYYGMNKKLTQLSREGYSPLLVGFGFAILHGTSKEPLNVKYDSIERYKEIEKKLPKWNQPGFTYQATGISDLFISCDPVESRWFFAISQADKKTDYKFITPSTFYVEYEKKNGLKSTEKNPLTPQNHQDVTNQINIEINALTKQGYKISNVSYTDRPTLLFERH